VNSEIWAGTKVLAVTGSLLLYGSHPETMQTRLISTALPGDTSIQVDEASGWVAGDRLALGPTESNEKEFEMVTIRSVNGTNVTLTAPLQFLHYGSPNLIMTEKGPLDMRAPVGHLTRNIKIVAEDVWDYGGRVLVTYYNDKVNNIVWQGNANLVGVEIAKFGRYQTDEAALDLRSTSNSTQLINSSIHDGRDWCLQSLDSSTLLVSGSVIANCTSFGVFADTTDSLSFN